jgi:hypothetical protein
MLYTSWKDAVKVIEEMVKPVSDEQQKLAQLAGIKLPPKLPRVVAASKLRIALFRELFLVGEKPVNEYRSTELKGVKSLPITPKNNEEAEGCLQYVRLSQRLAALRKLELESGDVVRLADGEKATVASIDETGKVYFKGRGQRSWPDMIESVLARASDTSAKAVKEKAEAENATVLRDSSPEWSSVKDADLADFAVEAEADGGDIDALESVIDVAKNERPIQEFLQQRPWLLAALIGGQRKFCLSQKRLGHKFIPDFILGGVDSLGVDWLLIEIETPRSGLYLKDGTDLDKYARKGVSQIDDWRNWLMDQIAYAQRPRSSGGLGLPNISNQSQGLVIVGRRNRRPKNMTDAKRREMKARYGMKVHSYDWLLQQLRGAVRFDGPYACNPFVIGRSMEERMRNGKSKK